MDFAEFMNKRMSEDLSQKEPKSFEEYMAIQEQASGNDTPTEEPKVMTVGETPPSVERSGFKGDWGYIAAKEGGLQTEGYIPMTGKGGNYKGAKGQTIRPVIGASGVTVGEGVDLGQAREDHLKQTSLPENVKEKILPYIGKKREDAVEALKAQPLQLTEEEAFEITDAFKKIYLDNDIMKVYDRNRREGAPEFTNLPSQIQTVLADMGWHMGAGTKGGGRFTRRALDRAGDGDFEGIIDVLEDSIRSERQGSNRRWFKERRRQEIDLLEDYLETRDKEEVISE